MRSKKPAVRSSDTPSGKRQVVALQKAIDEGRKELNDEQYWHIVTVLKKLADFGDPIATSELDIRPIDGIFELREKGGLLGKKNIRFFFQDFPKLKKLVISKTYRKDEEAQTPRHVIINAKTRLDQWKAGILEAGATFKPD